MPPAREVAFELERFAWDGASRLEVVGRWSGLRGRRLARPVLTVQAGGRRHRLPALPEPPAGTDDADAPWRAAFAWERDPGEIAAAELEVGRSLVVDLPVPEAAPGLGAPAASATPERDAGASPTGRERDAGPDPISAALAA